ncbi:S-adenosyl-L-methionine-dependent methyltransferase [Choiromyces venosus 120613-1]|uniref:rRNA adenine N(6)-methyltransferase n=1 Tax=Choiromyces venosus 120613-1 TaxID=1336337 RepID=A0A3N4JKH1_9PEZI|nr:S-adenosyl-L-methionine-dependent methyltransferase [Choiromyces venosus 120613-1]
MASSHILRRTAEDSIAYVRSLHANLGSFTRGKKNVPILVNPQICDPILDKLDLSSYQQTKTTIIDMNPAIGIFSAALHERLKPKQHILLEPQPAYLERMNDFKKVYKNSTHVPLDGYDWDTYNEMFSEDPPKPPWPDEFDKLNIKSSSVHDAVNNQLLFVGTLGTSTKNERLMAQFISCCALGTWIQQFGRVRFLLWVSDSIRDKYLPRSIAARARPAVTAEAVVDIVEVASSNNIRQGRGFHKLPVINPENVEEEEKKPMPSKRQELKKKIKQGLVEKEIKKLVAEELPFASLVKTRGRPKKLPKDQQTMLAETTVRCRQIVEEIRDGKEPKLPIRLPLAERMTIMEKYDQIRRALGLKSKEELAAETITKKDTKMRRKLKIPRPPGRPRKLPRWDKSPTIAELESIEQKINETPGIWVEGMQHPPWFYQGNKKELRELAMTVAAAHPSLRVDPTETLQAEDVCSAMLEVSGDVTKKASEGEESSAVSESVGRNWEAARAWEEYEEQWARRHEIKSRKQGREDEIYAVHNKLLKIHDRKYEPIAIDPNEDFFPHTPMTLLEITPKIPNPYFSPPTAVEREENWQTFEWFVRNLFVLRASSIYSALRSLAPGAEYILAGLPPDHAIRPNKRVRCLTTDELVNLTEAWKKWPSKTPISVAH